MKIRSIYDPICEAVRAADAILSFIAITEVMSGEAKTILREYFQDEINNTRAPEDLRDRKLLSAALDFVGDKP